MHSEAVTVLPIVFRSKLMPTSRDSCTWAFILYLYYTAILDIVKRRENKELERCATVWMPLPNGQGNQASNGERPEPPPCLPHYAKPIERVARHCPRTDATVSLSNRDIRLTTRHTEAFAKVDDHAHTPGAG